MSHIVSRGFDSIRFVTFLRVLLFSKFNASQHLNDFIQVIVNFYWAWNFLLCQGNADFLYIYIYIYIQMYGLTMFFPQTVCLHSRILLKVVVKAGA